MRLHEFIQPNDILAEQLNIIETAAAGATSAASIATVVSPQVAIGKSKGKKTVIGSPGKSGTKSPNMPKVVQPKSQYGTAKNALDIGNNIFGGPVKR